MGRLTVQLDELVEWPDIDFTLVVSQDMKPHDRQELDRLLIGWYYVGVYAGYGPADHPNGRGVLHNITEPAYDEDGGRLKVTW
jgi:hypothetical protein